MVEVIEDLGTRYPTSNSKKKKRFYKCRCECGIVFEAIAENVKAGSTTSCGCLRRKPETHGLTKHPYYKKWVAMRLRCTSPKAPSYKDYGARGISVCKQWLDDPTAYITYVGKLVNAGVDGYSIDRIDNDGNYEPGNVKWSTKSEQMTNTRRKAAKLSGEPHITWYAKTDKWRVRLDGKQIGSFTDLPDAVEARDSYMVG